MINGLFQALFTLCPIFCVTKYDIEIITAGLPVSFEKLYKRIQERALSIAKLLLNSAKRALEYLKGEAQNLLRDCAKSSYPARRTTLEKIERAGNRI